MTEKKIMIKSAEEIESMTVETVNVDVSLRERFISIKNIIDQLESEKKKIQSIVLEKYGHVQITKGEIFKSIVYDQFIVDEKKLVELYGQEALDNVKTRVKHTEYIRV